MKKITPCLWFDWNAEEAVRSYMSIFPESEIYSVSHYPDGTPEVAGKVLTIHFRLGNQEFIALNGGPMYRFTEAVSFSIDCKDQTEIDHYWNALIGDGKESMCGWLKDRFGLSWQVVPSNLDQYLNNPDPQKAARAAQALFQMKKIVIADLQKACED